jgi:hypothetical protein
MSRNYCITSGIVFAFVALMHAWRFALNLSMQIGAWNVPGSLSGLAAIAAALFAVWAFRSGRPVKTSNVVYT